jgi:hypothetical protein
VCKGIDCSMISSISPGTPALSIALIPRSESVNGIKAMAGLALGSPKFGSISVS